MSPEFKTGLAVGLSAVAVAEAQPAMANNPYAAPEAAVQTVDMPQAMALGSTTVQASELAAFSGYNMSIPAQTPPVEATPTPAPTTPPEATTSQDPPVVATMSRVDAKACADDAERKRYKGTLKVQGRKVAVTVTIPKLKAGCADVTREGIKGTGLYRMKIGPYTNWSPMTREASTPTIVPGDESRKIKFKRMTIPKHIYDIMCSKKATTSTGLKKGKILGFSVSTPHSVSAIDRNGQKFSFDMRGIDFRVPKSKVKVCR